MRARKSCVIAARWFRAAIIASGRTWRSASWRKISSGVMVLSLRGVEAPTALGACDIGAPAHRACCDRALPRSTAISRNEKALNERPDPRHRPGHDLHPLDRLRPRAARARLRAGGVRPALSRFGLGGARSRGSLAHDAGDRPRRLGQGRQASCRRRRHRHHQPARDDARLGPPHRRAGPPRHRLAGPPHRRYLRAAARRTAPSRW